MFVSGENDFNSCRSFCLSTPWYLSTYLYFSYVCLIFDLISCFETYFFIIAFLLHVLLIIFQCFYLFLISISSYYFSFPSFYSICLTSDIQFMHFFHRQVVMFGSLYSHYCVVFSLSVLSRKWLELFIFYHSYAERCISFDQELCLTML